MLGPPTGMQLQNCVGWTSREIANYHYCLSSVIILSVGLDKKIISTGVAIGLGVGIACLLITTACGIACSTCYCYHHCSCGQGESKRYDRTSTGRQITPYYGSTNGRYILNHWSWIGEINCAKIVPDTNHQHNKQPITIISRTALLTQTLVH